MIKGVIYSFTNYKGYGSYDYVGLRNYTDLFTDARVGKSYLFTFKYAIAGTVLVNVLSLVMAVALNSNIRGKSALRGIYFVPNILGGLVIGYIFSFIFTYPDCRQCLRMFTKPACSTEQANGSSSGRLHFHSLCHLLQSIWCSAQRTSSWYLTRLCH